MKNEEILISVVNEYAKLDEVDTIALSGSKTGPFGDKSSDYDIYIYSKNEVAIDFRQNLAKKYACHAEVGADFFGPGDEWILKDAKTEFDFMHRSIDWAKEHVENVWHKYYAGTGYTTAFIYNMQSSKILFDRNNEFAKIQKELSMEYPKGLKDSILKKNYPLLKCKMTASFYEQIKKAIKREDFISQNHRCAAFLASYFDVLFAINEKTHPGEKKLVPYVKQMCKKIPDDFEKNIENVVKSIGSEDLLKNIDILLENFDRKFEDDLKDYKTTIEKYKI